MFIQPLKLKTQAKILVATCQPISAAAILSVVLGRVIYIWGFAIPIAFRSKAGYVQSLYTSSYHH